MEKTFKDLNGNDFKVTFGKHDISKYDVLYHITSIPNANKIRSEGLKIDMPRYKAITRTKLLFFSYPINHDTGDLFRCYDDTAIIVLDAQALHEANVEFYDDWFSRNDGSSNKNHLCCDVPIDVKFIKNIVLMTDTQ